MKARAILLPIAMITIIVTYALATGGTAPSAAVEKRFDTANAALSKHDYQSAINTYEEMIRDGHQSAAIYFNLALARHHNGDLGHAIVNYERAARLDPGAADISTNLERARAESGTGDEPTRAATRIASSLRSDHWALVGASSFACLALIAVGGATRWLSWPPRRLLAATALGVFAIAASVTAISINEDRHLGRAIVVAAQAELRVSPFEQAAVVAGLDAGRPIQILDREGHGEFQLARLATGQTGWIHAAAIQSPSITPK